MKTYPYIFLDSGELKKLEQVGPYKIIRPCAQAVWKKKHPSLWENFDMKFSRGEENKWLNSTKACHSWVTGYKELLFKIQLTSFGHIGLFPEHLDQLQSLKKSLRKGMKILNLFAYTGAASLFFAKQGCQVTHVDASKTSISWAKENASLNQIEPLAIRWIIDDALKFLKREVKRGSCYQGIILDPPSYGRGSSCQVFKIEKDIHTLLELCQKVLAPDAEFVFFSCHTPGFTPQTMLCLMNDYFCEQPGKISSGEMLIHAEKTQPLPSGTFGLWSQRCIK